MSPLAVPLLPLLGCLGLRLLLCETFHADFTLLQRGGACKYRNWRRSRKQFCKFAPLLVQQISNLCGDGALRAIVDSVIEEQGTLQLPAVHFKMLSVWLFLWSKYVRILDCWPKGNVAFHSEIKGFVGFGWVLAHRHLLSFHIGQVGWRLRWYPLSSPSLHQFSYCRPQTLGGTVSNGPEYLRIPQNTSEHLRIPSNTLPRPIPHISDNSPRCGRPY